MFADVYQVRPNSHVLVVHRLFYMQHDYRTKGEASCKMSRRLARCLPCFTRYGNNSALLDQ